VAIHARSGLDLTTASLCSVAAHLVAGFLVLFGVHRCGVAPTSSSEEVLRDGEIELALEEPPASPQEATGPSSEVIVAPEPTASPAAGATVARLDQGKRGRGGDDRVEQSAINLADQDDRITLDPHTMTNVEKSQHNRIRSGKQRRARENWRASREPMELTFVAMGEAGTIDRRGPEAELDPRSGLLTTKLPATDGAARAGLGLPSGVAVERSTGVEVLSGGRRVGSKGERGVGVTGRARAGAPSRAFPNAHARPEASVGDPSTASTELGRPGDDVESEQADSAVLASILHASTTGGRAGKGRGGEVGPGAVGAGGDRGAGSTATPLGGGGTGSGNVDTTDYVRALQRKVHPFWEHAFPKSAILEGRSGLAIVAVLIASDGTVVSAKISRPSGVPEFDENVRQAVLAAGPYGALPRSLAPRLAVSLRFHASNPAVRPKLASD
jgi:TonB family protein